MHFWAFLLITVLGTFDSSIAAPICGTASTSHSLYAKGNSLNNSKINDQDGLNTCGANALSLTLQSSLKSTKNISYLDVAIQGARKKWTGGFLTNPDLMAIEGTDNVCDTLQSVKEAGGVCAQEYFSFENTVYAKWGGTDVGEKQKQLLKALSKYLDTTNKFGRSQEVKRRELEIILDHIKDQQITFADKCQANADGKAEVDFHQTFQTLMGKSMLWISQNKNDPAQKACVKATEQYFNHFVTTPISGKDQHPLDIRPEMKVKFGKTYAQAELLKKWRQGIITTGDLFSLPLAKFIDLQSASFPKEKNLKTVCNLTAPDSTHPLSGKKLYQPELTVNVLKELRASLNSEECEKRKLYEWLMSSKALKAVQALCPDGQGQKELLETLSLVPLFEKDIATILPRLNGKSGQINLNDLTSILAPDCAKNRQKIDHLACKEFNAFKRIQPIPLEELRTSFRNVSLSQLDKGLAIPLAICSKFLRGQTDDTIDTCIYEQAGFHGVTVTGYRCNKGALEYEVANSWGKDCPVKTGTKDKIIECVLDASGIPTGRFWVKENNLLKNVDKFYQIGPGGNK